MKMEETLYSLFLTFAFYLFTFALNLLNRPHVAAIDKFLNLAATLLGDGMFYLRDK